LSWHALPSEEVMTLLKTSPHGLSDEEASRRLKLYGPNRISGLRRPSALKMFFKQFRNALNYILAVAASISIIGGHYIDAAVILTIIFMNATLSFAQEYRSEKALEALKQLSAPRATVVRGGRTRVVDAESLVLGDMVVLAAGDIVPADMRVLTAVRLRVEESMLTGEPGSEEKIVDPVGEDVPLADRRNMLYAGTTVTGGRGAGVVVATGMNTEIGRIAKEVSEAGVEVTPLQRKVSGLAVYLAVIAVIFAATQGLLALLRGVSTYDAVLFALASAISSIPEGLIAVITLTLVVGMRVMAKRNALIRRLQAVETLGSAMVICTDKTGTLTRNAMVVEAIYLNGEILEVTGEGYVPEGEFLRNGEAIDPREHPHLQLLLKTMVLSSDARLVLEDGKYRVVGDPTEGALVVAAAKAGISKEEEESQAPRIDEVPFESERACMATAHRFSDGMHGIFTKGAPERIIRVCNEIYINGEAVELTGEMRRKVLEAGQEFASRGYRVLACAYRISGSDYKLAEGTCGENLIFLGLVGISDPPRREAIEAVEKCKRAGIRVVMITGDHKDTARAIAEKVGIVGGDAPVLDGVALDEVSDEELEELVESVNVFARTEPRHKLRIVRALKKRGYVVAMTGDGVNDAPALKEADVGIAMGIAGTQIAKEASDMVLADDNFASIVAAVEEGRTAFNNIRKVVTYLLTTNVAEDIVLFAFLILGFSLPFLPLQILWINLVTDGVCDKTLAVEPKELGVLQEPPRPPREGIVTRGVVYRIFFLSSIMALGTILVYYWSAQALGPLVLIYGYAKARTMAFYTIVFFQLFNALNARSSDKSILKIGLLSNKYLASGMAFSFALNVSIAYTPFFQELFHITPPSLHEWLIIILISSSVLIAEEARKTLTSIKKKKASHRAAKN